ncbi:isocitrate lyase/PEP mutase family protein [Aquisediminimonas profunda]|uniref:isocitrate lyase/PEP mutase family protein n=1 Tax=Aquisediminimonas profunda TaxID=1550733 RepID=UPI001C637F7B|nr:isocitrate lyase/phosphoenolpyruvate mutase family protein [Aquisediminimonas profunda]
MSDQSKRIAHFRALHEQGCFILPNPWDAGSAKRLQALGFKALASSSSAAAWTLGLKDHQITIEQILDHLHRLCTATDLPVNADFESGFAETPEGVAVNVQRALGTGIAGLSIEDQAGPGHLYPLDMAVARIRAARAEIDASGTGALLVARTEAYLNEIKDVAFAIERLTAFAEAGADCLFAPGMTDAAEIAETVKAVAPKPVNVLIMNSDMRVADLAALGVRRVSVGGALAAAAWRGFDAAAAALAEQLV